jgi:curved DNA-binding protein CbpA
VKVKGMCFMIVAFALILSYQNNPLGTIIVGGIGIVIYVFFKSRKKGTGSRRGWIFNKGRAHQASQMDDLIKLLVVQNFLNDRRETEKRPEEKQPSSNFKDLEKIKNETLSLFDEV